MFDGLQTPAGNADFMETFSGIQIPSLPSWHLCKDRHGRPALLVSISTEGSGINTPPSITLENLRVEHNLHCRIAKKQGDIITRHFSIVQCLSNERALHEYFLLTMSAIVRSLPQSLSTDQLSEAVDALSDLFLALQQAPKRSIQGLWAELFVIGCAKQPVVMLQAWHDAADERYDFSLGPQRIEVKSSGDRTRRHHFSLEQAYPPSGTDVLVASLFVEQAANGLGLGELWGKAREIAGSNSDLRLKVERICIDALGTSWSAAMSKRYDRQLAEQSLFFFDIRSMPRVSEEQPRGITDVRFRTDLTLVRPVDRKSYREAGPLFKAALRNE
jgi:hypothetical protein